MTRKPLGRGLGALIAGVTAEEEGADASGSNLIEAPLQRIVPSPFQPRRHFDAERLSELAEAIRAQGIIEPLVVRAVGATGTDGPLYELIAGERRLRAARQAGLETVPVVVRNFDDRTALEVSLVENLAREDLNAVDEARALVRLVEEFALSHERIAQRIGKSRPYVSNTIRLLDLPEAVLQMLESGELTSGQVRPLLALDTAVAQIAAAREIAARGISARGAEQMSRQRQGRSGNSSAAKGDVHLQALTESLQRALKRKVRVVRGRGKAPGRVEIEFYNDDDLTGLAAMLTGQSNGHTRVSAA
ncbi:MAG TPA: ParB/RepB/Spo0J family partition protein [Candidatus Binataceae bacterium]|nr:ParB/RepB/Spo0J family partition protein [Candidatus Binataceae bacterium]